MFIIRSVLRPAYLPQGNNHDLLPKSPAVRVSIHQQPLNSVLCRTSRLIHLRVVDAQDSALYYREFLQSGYETDLIT